jgi:hypothetical protein
MTVDKAIAARVIARRTEILRQERERPSGELDVREAGRYVERKLKAIRGYLYAFTKALDGKFSGLGYIETHAGPGITTISGSGRLLLGTPLLAITNEPRFTRLRVLTEDCNAIIGNVLSDFLPTWPTLILMDPEGLDLNWTTIVRSGEHPKSELMIVFPYGMAIQRVKGMEDKSAGVTRLYGHNRWKRIVEDLEAGRILPAIAKKRFLVMFRDQLREAGFIHTVVSEEITSDDGIPLYFLIHASKVPLAAKIGRDIFGVKGAQDVLPFGPPDSG